MASNGLTLAAKNCDIEIYGGGDTNGFICAEATTIAENRGSTFVGASSTGAPTYQDAEPFSRIVWESFSGGIGQEMQNRVLGGTGMGGDPSKFLTADAWTLKGDKLLPGMARDLVAPDNPSPINQYDLETPRGVLPCTHPSGALSKFTTLGAITFPRRIRVLVKVPSTTTNPTVTVKLQSNPAPNTGVLKTFTASAVADVRIHGFTWALLDGTTTTALAAGTYYLRCYYADNLVYGCFAGLLDSNENVFQPYIQLINSAVGARQAAYQDWTEIPVKFEQVNDAGTYKTIALTLYNFFNASAASNGEYAYTAATSLTGSIVFNNQLYFGLSDGKTHVFTATEAAKASTGTESFNKSFAIGSAIYHEGQIIYVEGVNKRKVAKWDGTSGGASTDIIADDKIGKPNSNGKNPINSIIIHQGLLYFFKPEGVFRAEADPSSITTGSVPQMVQLVRFEELEHVDNGRLVIEHQGSLYFNVRNHLYQLTVRQDGNEVNVLIPPLSLEKFGSYNYISGLTTSGSTIFVAYNNLGVYAYTGLGWHFIVDFYELGNLDATDIAGLRFVTNPTGGYDYLYAADARQLVRIPIPNNTSTYSTAIGLANQNKTMYWISSLVDFDLAEIVKFLRAFSLRAYPQGFNYKLVAAIYEPGTGQPDYKRIIEKALHEGLHRDLWKNPTTPASNLTYPKIVSSTTVNIRGVPTAKTTPCYWQASDLANSYNSHEVNCSPYDPDYPIHVVQVCFILFGWQSDGTQGSSTNDISYVESLVLKYLPIQDYIPVYQVNLDIDALMDGELGTPLTASQVAASLTWLRTKAGGKTPLEFKFIDTQGATKTVIGFIQNPRFDVDPQMVNSGEADSEITLPRRVSFNILSVESEYSFIG